ncbi:2-keto-4-pentenoate hydratase [Afifella sp. IM 167]|uniref:2-keto-4-pentenoate hydratase n=1 Tax=Afifella sp. IM 167 TaxID=2033586 RepID=UPI001CCF1B0E|nr:fumarylacetoacetate hydrolase family protein [Afifella sp. IM 167]MBZ8133392.1 hypothetical protein [Afifella sp. IM 167]
MSHDDMAAVLAAARTSGEYANLDLGAVEDRAFAEAVQASAIEAFGGSPVGYKIGATNEAAQKATGAPGPWFAPLLDTDIREDGSTLAWKDHYRGVECEFAFRMARTYPMVGETPGADSLKEAISQCHLALEVVGRRTAGEGLPRYPAVLADFGAHCAFILGPEVPNWADVDLASVAVKGLSDGEVTNEGSGAKVMGNPLNALLWLVEQLVAAGKRLEAGDYVSTGTTMGIVKPQRGAVVTGDFGDLGKVSVRFGQ